MKHPLEGWRAAGLRVEGWLWRYPGLNNHCGNLLWLATEMEYHLFYAVAGIKEYLHVTLFAVQGKVMLFMRGIGYFLTRPLN